MTKDGSGKLGGKVPPDWTNDEEARGGDGKPRASNKATTAVESFSAEEPPKPPGRGEDGRTKARSPIQKGQAASRKKKLLGREKCHAEEEKQVEIVPPCEPCVVGSDLPDESEATKHRCVGANAAAAAASADPPHWSVVKQGRRRRRQDMNRRAQEGGTGAGCSSEPADAATPASSGPAASRTIVRPGAVAVAVAGPGGESSPVVHAPDDNESGEAHALNAFVAASRRNNNANEGILVEGVVVGDEPKIARAECPRWLWAVGAIVGVGVIVTAVLAGTGHFVPKTAAPTAAPTTAAAPTAAPTTAAAPTDTPTNYAWCPSNKVLPDDVPAFNQLGWSVAIFGDTAVVGAPYDSDSGSNSGFVYVFIRTGTTWVEQAKLTPTDGEEYDNFGATVAIHGDTIVVGAPKDDDNGSNSVIGSWRVSAYVFVRTGTTWAEQAKLTPNDGASGDRFGESVAIDGDTIVVGAPNPNTGLWSGSAYIFVRDGTTWAEQTKLTPNDGAAYDEFGESVATDGDTIVVGAPEDDDNGSNSGSVYVFIRTGTTWVEQAKLTPNDGAEQDNFGESVAIDGDTIVIGAPDDDDNGRDSGSVYIFFWTGSTWMEQAKLTPTDGAPVDRFGVSVAIDGDTIVVGAFWDDDNGTDSGSAYVFVRNGLTWTQTKKLLAPDGAVGDEFGTSVGLSGNTAIVGARYDDTDNGVRSGSAHIIELC